MDYDMKKPCECCPFRRGTAMRLTTGRVRDVVGGMLKSNGGEFPCHRTIEHLEGDQGEDAGFREKNGKGKHCCGALIFAEKNRTSTQMMRICERIGMYDAAALMADKEVVDSVFDTFAEALKHLTSPQPEDELNNTVDNDSGRIQTKSNARANRKIPAGPAKRRRGNVEVDAVPRRQSAGGAQS
jgi:hypothetical protein